ncbi:MAG: peptidoglycan editing factor PgeF [Syntrophomonadaceae bacterium]|nr:peptidoglycan editing factor PgeF [Syntrophomonadaceae bacterium]
MPDWVLKEAHGLPLLMAEGLEGAVIAFSLRNGGMSEGCFGSLNLALHVGDTDEKVRANREIFMHSLSLKPDDMVCCQQVHGNRVMRVGAKERGRGALLYRDALPETDALITDCEGLALCTFYADCIPLYFFDAATRCIGMAHAGWKGTMAGIARHTLDAMAKEFGACGDTLQCFIGPGIGPCCFEVGDDVARRVQELYPQHDVLLQQRGGRCFCDLKLANKLMMKEWGIKEDNIRCSELCSCCEAELLYSYRRDKGVTGRMAALIMLTQT